MEIKGFPERILTGAAPVPETMAEDYKRWRPEGGIIIDDNCPLQISIVIVIKKETGELKVFRTIDPIIVSLLLECSKYPEEIKKIYQLKALELIASAPSEN